MASVTNLTGGSSSNGIYGSRNVLSGLASGMDTEAMIKNSVSGYQRKISSLQQQMQVLEWQQDSYRSIIDKMVGITKKYTSYSSSTNLYSASFFNKAVLATSLGSNADKVSATGKTGSRVEINGIRQLATTAKYSTGLEGELAKLAAQLTDGGSKLVSTAQPINWTDQVSVSSFTGSMTLTYGNKGVEINFGELDAYGDAEALAQGIRNKLQDVYITTSSGDYAKASTLIKVNCSEDGVISFSDLKGAGNSVCISSAGKEIEETLGFTAGADVTSFSVPAGAKLSRQVNLSEYLSKKTINVTLDGVTKKITLPESLAGAMTDLVSGLNTALSEAFGQGKVEVADKDGALTFTTAKGSTLAVSADAGKHLGLGERGITSYLNTSKTLKDVFAGMFGEGLPEEQDLIINGTKVGSFGPDTTLERIFTAINSNVEAGVSVNYSKITNQFVFTSNNTGEASQIDFGGADSLAAKLFGSTYQVDGDGNILTDGDGNKLRSDKFTKGTDAIFSVTINGQTMKDLVRNSNVVDLDGLSVTLQGTFDYTEDNKDKVAFSSKADTGKITEALKAFVEDYNALATELRSAYSTLPVQKSNGSKYLPLTDDDKASMTESAVKAYEEKAKQGVLFGDKDLSALYSRLRNTIAPSGMDALNLSKIGITTAYEKGLLTLKLDETALQEALESNPDSVRDAFTKTREGGASTDGLMYNVKKTMDAFASTSLASTGILVKRAGTPHASVSLLENTLQSKMDNLNDQIERWQTKMSDRVDYYTRQFTALEKLMSTMNGQSSMLSGLTNSY